MAPVVGRCGAVPSASARSSASPAQHREMLDQVLRRSSTSSRTSTSTLMRPGPGRSTELTARLLDGLDRVLAASTPDCVLVQGDTTTALAARPRRASTGASASATSRPGCAPATSHAPFPEEANRRIIDLRRRRCYFAPTARRPRRPARRGRATRRAILVTGNTVIDALHARSSRAGSPDRHEPARGPRCWSPAHRRESFGAPLRADLRGAARARRDASPTCAASTRCTPTRTSRGRCTRCSAGSPNVDLHEPLDYLRARRAA